MQQLQDEDTGQQPPLEKEAETQNQQQITVTSPTHSQVEVDNLKPTPIEQRSVRAWHIMTLWVGMAINIPAYLLGATLVQNGLNWWQALITVIIGNLILLIPLSLNGEVGVRYGIPFPVFIRAVYGKNGSKVAAMIRGIIGCGWFGIQIWIGGDAAYRIVESLLPHVSTFKVIPHLDVNWVQLVCFFGFWVINIVVLYTGPNSIKWIELISSPVLIAGLLALFGWAWVKTGSIFVMMNASYQYQVTKQAFWKLFFPGLTGVIGFWATLSLNIMDFTRYAKSQRDQVVGHVIGLLPISIVVSSIGIFVTCATISIYGTPISNPLELVNKFAHFSITILAMVFIVVATLTTNLAGNMVAAANDISNIYPRKITFRIGGTLTAIIGIVMFPWKLLGDPNAYLYRWLVGSSSLLGAIGGIMIADYYVLRRRKLVVEELYNRSPDGLYRFIGGWNYRAVFVTLVAVVPSIPGFIAYLGVKILVKFPSWILRLYDWAWFTAFGVSFILYLIVNIKNPHYKKNEEMFIQAEARKIEEAAKAAGKASPIDKVIATEASSSKFVELEEVAQSSQSQSEQTETPMSLKSPVKTPTAIEINESASPLHAPVEMAEENQEGKTGKKEGDEIILFY